MKPPWLLWVVFNVGILLFLVLDLAIIHRKARKISMKEALLWSGFWIGISLLFNVGIYFTMGYEPAINFLAGYLLEKSLSVDNLFVFLLIFNYFQVPEKYVHRVLSWGIIGALIMRGLFIIGGLHLIHLFHWMIYLFGLLIIYAGIQLAFQKETKIEPEKNWIIRLFRKVMPVTKSYEGEKFFVRRGNTYWATPLFLVLLMVETSDLLFALDSIPAIFAITLDPFIVYTSNVFAILGLRALYFALSGVMGMFRYLHYGLAFILVFIGIKMLISEIYPIPVGVTLGVIGATIGLSILASYQFKFGAPRRPEGH